MKVVLNGQPPPVSIRFLQSGGDVLDNQPKVADLLEVLPLCESGHLRLLDACLSLSET